MNDRQLMARVVDMASPVRFLEASGGLVVSGSAEGLGPNSGAAQRSACKRIRLHDQAGDAYCDLLR